jgi:hypothetical protein
MELNWLSQRFAGMATDYIELSSTAPEDRTTPSSSFRALWIGILRESHTEPAEIRWPNNWSLTWNLPSNNYWRQSTASR